MTLRKKCSLENCKRKIKLSEEIECRCGLFFCAIHRFCTEHNCSFDYKKEQREKLKKLYPKVQSDKMEKI